MTISLLVEELSASQAAFCPFELFNSEHAVESSNIMRKWYGYYMTLPISIPAH
jgi:hypothetical protein